MVCIIYVIEVSMKFWFACAYTSYFLCWYWPVFIAFINSSGYYRSPAFITAPLAFSTVVLLISTCCTGIFHAVFVSLDCCVLCVMYNTVLSQASTFLTSLNCPVLLWTSILYIPLILATVVLKFWSIAGCCCRLIVGVSAFNISHWF